MNQGRLARSLFRRPGIFLSALLILVSSLQAAEKADSKPPAQPKRPASAPAQNEATKAEPVIVTATRLEQSVSTLTVPYSVVTAEEIEVRKNPQALEYLRDLPGVTVNQTGQRGRQADVQIRGANSNHTLVLVDGVRVNSPTTGQYNFNALSSENIERIEVIRGPQSALYGSDAIGGIVNIITKKGKGPPKATGQFEYGTHYSFNEATTFNAGWEHVNVSGSFARNDTEGRSLDDEFDSTDASARLGVDITERLDLESTFHYNKNFVDIDDGAFRVDPNRFTRTKDDVTSVKLHALLGESWDHTVQFSAYHNANLSVDPPDPNTRQTMSIFKLDSNIYDINYFNSIPLWDFMTITSGVEYEYQYSNNKTFKRILRNTGVYFEDQIALWDRWNINIGGRFENNSKFGVKYTPHVSGRFDYPETGSAVKAGYGQGFRAPTLNQLFFPNFGNPNLEPEESSNYDIGWEQKITPQGFLELDLFHSSIQNLIQSVTVNGVSTATNIGKGVIDGVELQTRWNFKNLSFRVYYDLLLTQDKSNEGKSLVRRPKHAGGVSGQLRLWDKWTAYADLVVVGARRDQSGLAGRPRFETDPPYEKLDLTLSYDWNPWLQLYGRIENVTSRFYTPVIGFPADGTLFFVGAKVNWAIESEQLAPLQNLVKESVL